MKLLNILSITVMGTLFAVGCSSTTTITNDGGTDGGTNTGDTGTKTDTGTVKTDSATTGDTGPGPVACTDCQEVYCAEQNAACSTAAAIEGCNNLITCIQDCSKLDAGATEQNMCANKCVTDSTSAEGKALVACMVDCSKTCTK